MTLFISEKHSFRGEIMKYRFIMSCFISCIAFSNPVRTEVKAPEGERYTKTGSFNIKPFWTQIKEPTEERYTEAEDFSIWLFSSESFWTVTENEGFGRPFWTVTRYKTNWDFEAQRGLYYLADWVEEGAVVRPMLLSEREFNQALLYGREEEGGNFLHHLVRQKDLDPLLVEELITAWASEIPARKFSKVLKHRDSDDRTPKELARSLQNEAALKALSSAEDIMNNRNTKRRIVSGTVSVGGMAAGAFGAAKGLILPEQAAMIIGSSALLSISCLNVFKNRKISKTSAAPLISQPE